MEKKRKILHINYSDSKSGAAIAAKRHCEAMIKAGYEVRMLVARKSGNEKYIYQATSSPLKSFLYKLTVKASKLFVNSILKPYASFSYPIFSIRISKHSLVKWADVIYIHWVAGGMMNEKEIERILKTGKPVRWFMHDMNPITGGCHHALSCKKYLSTCSNCPQLDNRINFIDFAKLQYLRRERIFSKYHNLEAYTPSKWLGECVTKSGLWKNKKVVVFPNVIDLNIFKSIDKENALNFFKLDGKKRIVLLGAVGWNSPYKGAHLLIDTLNYLPSEEYEALIFGDKGEMSDKIRIHCNYTGYISNPQSLIMAYNAADVFVSSSIAENFPNVILEAMSCGLPCVAFNVGGIPDLIKHKENGYLANPRDFRDLATGIEYICSMPEEKKKEIKKSAVSFVNKVSSYNVYRTVEI